jgi:hypothetical protein
MIPTNSNHLIVGLGGTGGKAIRAFRRTIYEEYRKKEPVVYRREESGKVIELPHKIKLGYLYVDSDAALMEPNHPSWKVPGDTLQLGKSSQLLIKGANLTSVLENLGAYPNISPWIGDRAEWRDILGSVVGEALGGQKRRLGRFLFACKANDATEGFVGKIKHQVDDLRRRSGENSITFHVCTGLAGGTGSGSIIDVVAQIRRLYPDDEHRVVLYCLLPEAQPPSGWDSGNYHANGYGALVELNALATGAFHPHDVAESTGRITFRDASGNPFSPFSGAYLFTNENENGRVLSLEKDEVSQMVGSFLFQKIVVSHSTPWSDSLRRVENAENGDGSPESIPGANIPQRSKRFLTFGIKRLIIPEEEIREFISFSFARQAVLQLQFNNWSATQGYMDLPQNDAFAQYVADERNHERWRMSDPYLNLERGILPAEELEKWGRVEDDWKVAVNGFLQVAMKAEDAQWMSKLAQLSENHFAANWRSKGVSDFFRMKEGDLRDQAREIRKRLEADLWTQWVNGSWSMFDISRLLGELRHFLEDKLNVCERQITKFRALVEDGKAKSAIAAKIRENNVTWAKIGPISAAFGKRKNIIQAQAECFKEYYAARHRVESWSAAVKLVQQILTEVGDLADTVQSNTSTLAEMVKGDTNSGNENRFVGLVERIEARCKESNVQDLKDQIVKLYDPAEVRSFSARLLRDEGIQHTQTKAVREAIVTALGERADFSTFRQKMVRGLLMDLLEKICDEQAEKAHNNLLAAEPNLQRLLGANIVDILARKYSGNTLHLRDFIRELVSSAGNYLRFDPMEEKRTGPGAGPVTTASAFAVLLPDGADYPDFRNELEEAFRAAYPQNMTFYVNPKSTEITMVGIRNLFPLRYAKQVALLCDKHRERIARFPRARLEVHCEGDCQSWPPVFLPDGGVVRKGMQAWILLGKVMDGVKTLENPDTGSKGLYLVVKDARGREQRPIFLAQNEEELAQSGDPTVSYQLESMVRAGLNGDYLHRAKREELVQKLDDGLKEMQKSIPNPLDKRREAYEEAVATAEKILEQRGE